MSRRSSEFVPQFKAEGHGNHVGCSRATSVAPRAGRVCARATRPRRPTRPTASPRRAGGGSLREAGGRWRARATRHRRTAGRSAGRAPRARAGTHQLGCATPMTILMAMARSSRSAVWCCNSSTLAARLEHPEVFFDAPAPDVPLQDARGVVGAGHTQRGQQEPLQRLARGRRLFPRARGRPTVRPARRRGRAAPPAGSAASRRRHAPRGGPCGPVCWPSPARSAAAPRPWRRLGPARCAPYRTDGARPSARRASFPCRGRGRPWRGPTGRPAGQPRGARRTGRGNRPRGPSRTPRGSGTVARPPAHSRAAPRPNGTTCAPRAASGAARLPPRGSPARARPKAARSTPNATPSGLTAKVVCNSRPRATAPVWFEPMAPSPCVCPRRVKFNRVPS